MLYHEFACFFVLDSVNTVVPFMHCSRELHFFLFIDMVIMVMISLCTIAINHSMMMIIIIIAIIISPQHDDDDDHHHHHHRFTAAGCEVRLAGSKGVPRTAVQLVYAVFSKIIIIVGAVINIVFIITIIIQDLTIYNWLQSDLSYSQHR